MDSPSQHLRQANNERSRDIFYIILSLATLVQSAGMFSGGPGPLQKAMFLRAAACLGVGLLVEVEVGYVLLQTDHLLQAWITTG